MRKAFLLAGVGMAATCLASACMTRPVTSTEPHTSNLYVEPIRNDVIDKIDLLFMIDNSRSMGDKQKLLAKAVPQLVSRLVVPRCSSGTTGELRPRASVDEACPPGMEPEFRAVRDIHVAVITSSLGSHGAENGTCDSVAGQAATAQLNDRGLLLPSVRAGLTSYGNSGFLAWDPDRKLAPPGEADPARLGEQFGEMVRAAGEVGCGYESSLESWYRFLIDPEPPLTYAIEGDAGHRHTVVKATDTDVLAQRAAFLRPDSLVAIVMLTDENDCSISDEGYGFMAADSRDESFMWRGNSACANDPNDPCCGPCVANAFPGCPPNTEDPVCAGNRYLERRSDPTNLRCLEAKRRFGYDFLYPTSRYVKGLTERLVPQRSTGEMVENPLFKAVPGFRRREKSMVYLAGIVGVPWQDVADDASLTGPGLHYLSADALANRKRWEVLVGDSQKNLNATDPFMLESTEPRSGQNPITLDVIAPASSLNPQANSINGHEQVNVDGTDLQYACTFKLSEPAPCSGDATESCDCIPPVTVKNQESEGDLARNRPLCQPPAGGPAEPTQYFGKAYPGRRPLEVLRDIGDSAIVASICPKVLTEGQPGYGYEPAIDAIVDRLKVVLSGRCLPRPLAAQATAGGALPCVVVEAVEAPAGSCRCDAGQRRSPASAEARSLVQKQLASRSECDSPGTPSCASLCFCELAQSEGPALDQCLNSESGGDIPGYCYIDPFGKTPQGNPDLVRNCDDGNKQLIRFVGPSTPTPSATTFIACLGATL